MNKDYSVSYLKLIINMTITNKEKFKVFRFIDEWWDVNGKFKPLHVQSNTDRIYN